jgi:outer membrane protein assembly factor BamD
VDKEYYSAKLYYDLGSYFGNCTSGGSNYEACIITAQNAIKDFPYSRKREEFALLVMKSKFELAQQSVEARKLDRFRDAEDECYGFINEYPDSPHKKTAEKYIAHCKKYTANMED